MMINCINGIAKLFQCPCTRTSAIILAAAAFVLGVIVMCIICKLTKPCNKKCAQKGGNKPAKKEERPFEKRKPHPAPADGSVEIYVGNLSYEMTEEELRETFAAYGTVTACRLVTNRYNGKSKGFGFIQMPVRAEAEAACAALNDKEIQGRKMKCNEAKNLI